MRLSPVVAVLAFSIMSGGVARASGPSPPCGPQSARTLSSDADARVYETGGRVYGCVNDGPRRIALGSSHTCFPRSEVTKVALSGIAVAYTLERCGVDTGSTEVRVRRLSDGTLLGTYQATSAPLPPESYTAVDALVVKADGAAAWIGSASSVVSDHRVGIQVRTARGGHQELLDSGPAVRTTSLRLQGSRLSWLHGRTQRSARLR